MDWEGVTDNGRRIVGSNTRFSASNNKNNSPHIILLGEVRSLNYTLIVLFIVSPSLLPFILSICQFFTSTPLISILYLLIQEYIIQI